MVTCEKRKYDGMMLRGMSHQAYREDIACTFGLPEIQVLEHAYSAIERFQT